MLCTAPPALRTAAFTCRLSPAALTSFTSYSTAPCARKELPTANLKRAVHPNRHVTPITSFSPSRSASTISASAIPAATTTPSTELLDWNTFFKLRRQRRFFQLGSSVGTGMGGFVLGASAVSWSDMDALVSQIPLDPFLTLGLITFTCGGLGWLAGPVLGTATFNWRIGSLKNKQMSEKEVEFYRRVKKYRVDPAGGSVANPIPDYYGEKIASVKGYRQWLKDQRAFNKKRLTYV